VRRARTVAMVGGVVALAVLGAVAASVAGGRGEDSANGSVPVRDLDELAGAWVAVNDTTTPAPLEGTVRLVFEGGRVFAETGCNAANGPVAVVDSVLVADALVSTRRACAPALMAQEQWVVDMLTSRPRLERSGPYLALHWGEGERWWLGLEEQARSLPTS